MYGRISVRHLYMPRCYAYIRVSTVKQGEKGVSLQEQHAAITRYAERGSIQIAEWFEERLTAAKQGRPLFAKMLRQLRKGLADGVIIHKIDRGARNLRDWAEIAELNDAGIAVHFANESVDLQTRGGRLSADIQAVVAADYVRNLREETLKGIYGRLKQGICPFAAPIGYLDMGAGQPKAIDPTTGSLVREAFELYASGRFSLDTLLKELHRRGLRSRSGGYITKTCLSKTLNNPFYTGIIRLRSTGETFPGKHEALVDMRLFQQVRTRLAGRVRSAQWKHDYTYRGLFKCSDCGRKLIAEKQKGHIYYRCHTKACQTQGFREERLDVAMLHSWPPLAVTAEELELLRQHIEYVETVDGQRSEDRITLLQAQLGNVKRRVERLVDAFLDNSIDKPTFEERKRSLVEEQRSVEDAIRTRSAAGPSAEHDFINEKLELVSMAQQSHSLSNPAFRRELAIKLCSNLSVSGKRVVVEPYYLLRLIGNRPNVSYGGPYRNATRTFTLRDAWKMLHWTRRWLKRTTASSRTRKQEPPYPLVLRDHC